MKLLHQVAAILQCLLLASPLAFYSSTAQAGCPACSKFEAASAACKNPAPAASPAASSSKVDLCADDRFQQDWGQIGHQCAAVTASEKGKTAEMVTASVYTAAAAVCTSACIAMHSPIIAASSALLAACTVSGTVAGITDLTYSILIGNAVGGVMGGLVGAAGAVGSAAVTGVASSSAGHKIAGSPCWSMGILFAVAGIKWYMMSNSAGAAREACNAAGKYADSNAMGNGGGSRTRINTPLGTKNPLAPYDANAGAPSPYISNLDNLDGFPSTHLSAAKASPDIFGAFPNSGTFPEALKELNINPGDIARQLENQSPAALLSGMSGMPDNIRQKLWEIDDAIKSGGIQLTGGGGGVYSGGSGGGSGAVGGGSGKNPFGDLSAFGKKKDEAVEGPALLKLSAKDSDISSLNDDDIWHSTFKGTIFEIVSHRLTKSRDKILPGEWATPLNRALMGLPAAKNEPTQ
ncbi:MAG: hypothetical protein A2Z97_03825 [Bdellovibrionales bacterium GWB1_52_6]|nr:MAG: hypothetical protein A2Z97_03825 [Bdellovibrionales bacterium GWB1_52_6]OFZ03125.1 MAG: hypothetical protein A2X97_09830 [Bdellovibrionales bacterium GWA1_52_35]HCM40454.1 hypothetical protein [Bdellovibrionales bacterium]